MRLLGRLFVFLFCVCTLGLIDIKIAYTDGSRIQWVGFLTRLIRWLNDED